MLELFILSFLYPSSRNILDSFVALVDQDNLQTRYTHLFAESSTFLVKMACGRGRPSGSIKRNEPTSIDSQEQTIKRKRGRPFGSFKRKPSPSPSVSPVPKKTRTRTTRNSIRASSRTSTRTSRNSTQLSTQCSTQGDVNDASIQFYISNNVEESADEIERLGSLHQKAYSKVDTAVGSIAEVRLFSLLADRRVNVVFVCGDGVGRVCVPFSLLLQTTLVDDTDVV